MPEYKVGAGFDDIGTRAPNAQGVVPYYNKISGADFENPDMLSQFANSRYGLNTTAQNVFDVLSQGSPTQIINQAQQSAFDQIKASPTSDPNVLREQANEIIGSNVQDIQNQIKQYTSQLDSLLGNVSSFFQQSEAEQKLTKQLNNLDTSYEMGQNAIEDKPMAMQFITGEQASNERRYVQRRNTLVRQLQSETATRQQKLEAARFLYDATRNRLSDTIQLMQATAPDSIANSVDPVTGEMTVIMRNPITGQITKRNLGQVQTPHKWSENVAFAQQNGVTTPFYTRDGRTIINTNSGREYSTPEQFFAEGGSFDPAFMKANVQTVNPQLQQERAIVAELAVNYPDAGIALSDSLAAAQQKLGASFIYQDEVRPPLRSGGGGGSRGGGAGTVSPSKELTRVKQIISMHPGEWGHAADQIDAEFGPGTATKYDDLLKAAYAKKGQDKFLTTDYFKNLIGTTELERLAKESKYTTGGFLGMGKKADINSYLNNLMTTVDQYRQAGFTDDEILKLMQK